MAWWGNSLDKDSFQPKQKNRFLLLVGGSPVYTVKTVTKPSADIETKQYQMINHYYNYPGLVKWNPIEVTLVDGSGVRLKDNKLATAEEMWRMLMFSGYATPDMAKTSNYRAPQLSTPEKASMVDRSSLGEMQIAHLDPEGKKTIEYWTLVNPMITSFKWGSLDYTSDELVEYSFTVTYDWAKWSEGSPEGIDTTSPPVNTRFLGNSFGALAGDDPLDRNVENYKSKYGEISRKK